MSRIRPRTRRRVASSPASHSGKHAVRSASAPARLASSSACAPWRRARSSRRLVGGRCLELHPGFLQRQDLLEEVGRRLGLSGRAEGHALEVQEVLHAADGIPEGAVGRVHRGRSLQADALLLRGTQAEVVRMETPVQRVEALLEVGPVKGQPALDPEHVPVIAPRRKGLEPAAIRAGAAGGRGRAASPTLRPIPLVGHRNHQLAPKHRPGLGGGPVSSPPVPPRPGRDAACPPPCCPQAVNDVPQPQLDFALGLTKVKPPVRPWVT